MYVHMYMYMVNILVYCGLPCKRGWQKKIQLAMLGAHFGNPS